MQTKRNVRPRLKRQEWLAVAEIASRQHGVVSLGQLRELGFRAGAVRNRVGLGQLHTIHRGVYAVGHPAISQRGAWMASVLAVGADAVLSHRSAAAVWGLLPPPGATAAVTIDRQTRSQRGIHTHHCRLLLEEVTERHGIPVTSVPRTLVDIAAVAPHLLERAVNEAEVLRLSSWDLVEANLRINRGRRGSARLRAAVPDAPMAPVRSELERRFLSLVHGGGLPQPETGVLVELDSRLFECDCVWRDARLIVELDGRSFHDTAGAFERDRSRDRALQAAGWRVVRVTWTQIQSDPESIVSDLRQILKPGRD